MNDTHIESKTQRARLAPRRDPYWSRVTKGLFIGYRVPESGAGTWIARCRGDDGRQQFHALGTFDEKSAYDEARKAAAAWAAQLDQGVKKFDATLEDACRAYVTDLKVRKTVRASTDADKRFARLVYGTALGRVRLDKLQSHSVKTWLNSQVVEESDDDPDAVRRSKDSANRNLSSLKAALNFALAGKMVATDSGWRTVKPFAKVGKRRDLFLTRAQRKTLIDAAPGDLANLMRALLMTAVRPGELATATIKDFDPQQGTLKLNGKTGARSVTLSTEATRFFSEQAKNKIGNAPLLSRADGARWTKDWWKKLFRPAVKEAKLPNTVVLYSLRHAAISEMIAIGIDILTVARLAGTSVAMIDKHYGHLRHDLTREKLDAVAML